MKQYLNCAKQYLTKHTFGKMQILLTLEVLLQQGFSNLMDQMGWMILLRFQLVRILEKPLNMKHLIMWTPWLVRYRGKNKDNFKTTSRKHL